MKKLGTCPKTLPLLPTAKTAIQGTARESAGLQRLKDLVPFGARGKATYNCGSFLNYYLFTLFLVVLGLHCGAQASHFSDFSCCRAQAVRAWSSVVGAFGLSSCGPLT